MTTYKPHITDVKKGEVEDIKRLFNEYPVAGIVNLENLPTLQLQRIKKSLKGKIILKHAKKRFMQIAFDQLQDKKNITELKEKLKGVPAIIFTKEDPFNLFKLLKKSQSAAAAKPGQEAPEDLKFPAGPTSFTPGPMIGELGQLGLKTEIVDGKIHVGEEKVLVKEGEIISAKIAELLAKIGIEPMKVGLNLTFTYENGEILGKEVLGVDEEEYIQNIKTAHSESLSLALAIGYATPETVKLLVSKGAREALALAKEANIQTSETVKEQLAEAESAAKAIEAQVPVTSVEEKKEEKPAEEPKHEPVEEKKEEPKLVEESKPEETPAEEPKPESKEEVKKESKEKPKEETSEEKKEEHLEEKVEEAVEEETKEEPVAQQQEETPKEEVKEEPKQEQQPEKEEVITNAPEEKLEEIRLKDTIQMDEAYRGGKKKGYAILGAKQKASEGMRRKIALSFIPKPSVDRRDVVKLITQRIEPGSKLNTDGAAIYKGIDKYWPVNHTRDLHRKFEFEHTSEIEGTFGNYRTFVRRMYHHHRSTNLEKYVREFCFRFSSPELFKNPLFYLTKSLRLEICC